MSGKVDQAPVLHLHAAAQAAMNAKQYEHAHGLCQQILQHDRAFPDAYFLLGIIALTHRQAAKALTLIEHACSLSENNAEYHAHKAQCLAMLKRDADAVATARAALALAPDKPLTLDTIGVSLVKAGAYEMARGAFESAVNVEPDNAQFQFNLASCLQFLGALQEARTAYENAIRLKPDFYRAYWAVSALRTATADDNRLDFLRDALANSQRSDERLYLGHTIAKELEDLGRYPESLQALHDGKILKREEIRYSFDRDRRIFDALTEICDGDFLGRNDGFESREPLFIVGMPRTGTTLAERIVSAHPDVTTAGELNNFGLLVKKATRTPGKKVLDAPTIAATQELNFRKLGEAYIGSTRPKTGSTMFFVDKMPLNVLYAGLIHRALPNAKIICLRRNAMDTCISNYRQLFATEFSYYDYSHDLIDTARYFLCFDALVAHWKETLGPGFLEIHYEDLVENTEENARKMLDFCGLAWDDSVLGIERNPAPVATASAAQVRTPVYRTSVDRWKRYGEAVKPLAEFLGKELDEPLYEPP